MLKMKISFSGVRESHTPYKAKVPDDVLEFLKLNLKIQFPNQESFWIVPVRSDHSFICKPVELFRGSQDSAPVDPRIVFRILLNTPEAVSFIAVHNHPSGDLNPSGADRVLTEKLVQASQIMGFGFLDHLIVNSDLAMFKSCL